MKTKKLMIELSDLEIEEWQGLPPEEIEEMLRQGASDRLLGKWTQNPGHPIYSKGYKFATVIDELLPIIYSTFKPRVSA